jgi:hypothetical protein
MSRKSISVRLGAELIVSVLAVPNVLLAKYIRRTALPPTAERVPLMVWLALKVTVVVSPDEGLIVRLLKTFVPCTDLPAALVPVKETLLKVTVPPLVTRFAVEDESWIRDDPALNVRFVALIVSGELIAESVTVLAPRLIVRVLVLFEFSAPAVNEKLAVVKVP